MRVRNRFAVLLYHEVGRGDGHWVTPPDVFARHLDHILDQGGHFRSTGAILEALRGGSRLPPRCFCVHFDDGRAGVLRHAMPALADRGIPATVFVVPGWLEGEVPIPPSERYAPLLDWGGVEELSRGEGVEIGSHGWSHVNLKKISREGLDRECRDSKRALEERTGLPVRHIASPYNRFSRRIVAAVRAAGYETLSVGRQKVNGSFCRPHSIKRFLAPRTFGSADLDLILAALETRSDVST